MLSFYDSIKINKTGGGLENEQKIRVPLLNLRNARPRGRYTGGTTLF